MGLLDGKVAVITGAGSGMGKASVKTFVREGARVVAGDISGAEKDTAAALGENVIPVHCDVTREADIEAMVRAAVEQLGRSDVMLNVAGIADGAMVADITQDHYDRMLDVDLRGVLFGMKHGIRAMLEAGNGGAIVNWSSVGGLGGAPFTSVYSAAKHGDPATSTPRSRWPSTPTEPSRPRTSTSYPTAAPTPRPGRSPRPRRSACCFPGPYRVPRASFTTRCVYTNTVGRSPYRGPWQFESLAREVLLDIAARQLAIDPVELRRRNLLRRDELPYRNPNGMTYDSVSPQETFEQALEMLDYDVFRAEQASARATDRYLGVGLANYVEPSTPGYGSYATEAATIRVEPSGRVNVHVAGGSSGNSIETTVVQLTADALGADIDDVTTIQGRHRRHRLRSRCRRQPQRVDDRRRGPRDRVGAA
jgi:hypothetical protein